MFKNGSANILHIRHSISPATRQINAAVCTVSSVPFASPTPSLCATLTLTPPPIPIRKPVNKDTNSVVEPTDPRGIYPAYFPTIATSLKLNNTYNIWEHINGMLKRKMFFHKEPDVIPILFLLLSALLLITLFHFGWFAIPFLPYIFFDNNPLYDNLLHHAILLLFHSYRWISIKHRLSCFPSKMCAVPKGLTLGWSPSTVTK